MTRRGFQSVCTPSINECDRILICSGGLCLCPSGFAYSHSQDQCGIIKAPNILRVLNEILYFLIVACTSGWYAFEDSCYITMYLAYTASSALNYCQSLTTGK